MTVEDEGRQKAITLYRAIVGLMGVVSAGLLVCALLAVIKYDDEDSFGPPYYIGGFTGGIMGLVYVGLCTCILVKVPHIGTDDLKKREVGCAMMGQYILSMFMFMGCFIGIVFAGIGGLGSTGFDEEERDPAVKTLAICIMLGCIIVLGINILGMCTICTYGVYFGVHITSNRRRVLILNQNPGTHQTMFSTSTATSNAQVRNLEAQNRLLQQQLQLQQMLNQQQSTTGNYQSQFTYPPPPPSYSDASYPPPSFSAQPSAPPPSYDKII